MHLFPLGVGYESYTHLIFGSNFFYNFYII
ncbi:hypothetical protein J2771_001362 [Acinetobacter calcoaceticus]|uniref:Uncharacterized protein n=1 Tax=Acinetobacter calcoaceticus TaxID=471 RepID=A0ABD5AL77_ACICA|nr:hypothetical protein [Acinetobacter calcoaceticus]